MSAPPTTIAFLSHFDLNLYRFRRPIMRALVQKGCRVLALCPPGDFSGRFAADGVEHVPYRVERSSLNPFKELGVVQQLAGTFRRLRPDLVHAFMMKPNIYGALAARFSGAPRFVASVTGLGSFYSEDARASVPARAGRWALDRLYASALSRADRVIFYNKDDLADLRALGVYRGDKETLIAGSGVDLTRFRPRESARPAGPVVVTMAARLIKHKGVEVYLAAAETLKKKWGERVVFQLAGEPDPGNPWAVDEALLSRAEAGGAVARLGFVEDMAAVLGKSDIYALPSWYREGLPVSVLEAMGAGLPVVTTDSVGCRDTVEDGKSGLLVPPKDAAALAGALDRLIGDPALRASLGAAARRRAEAVFSADKIVEAHLAVYRALLPGRGL